MDGDYGTRWASAREDNQWLYVDLGKEYVINRVVIHWETAYGREYKIEVSNDPDVGWQEVYYTKEGKGGIEDISFDEVKARYVRMYGIRRGTQYGFSIWEFEVYGSDVVMPGGVHVDDE